MSDKTNGVNNAVSCYIQAVQVTAPFVMSVFAILNKICEMAMNLAFFSFGSHELK